VPKRQGANTVKSEIALLRIEDDALRMQDTMPKLAALSVLSLLCPRPQAAWGEMANAAFYDLFDQVKNNGRVLTEDLSSAEAVDIHELAQATKRRLVPRMKEQAKGLQQHDFVDDMVPPRVDSRELVLQQRMVPPAHGSGK
jgi:hypothetical protein